MICLKCQKEILSQAFYGLHSTCFVKWFKLPALEEFYDLDPKSTSESSIKKIKGSFYHGNYLKYSAKLSSARYILKVQQTKFPDLPAMEYVCNMIASLLGLTVPEFYLIKYPNTTAPHPRMTFVTKNFMQNYKGSTLHHIYKFLPKRGYKYNCKNIVNIIAKQTERPADVSAFVKICVFDSLIGNHDRHGRNLGIIDTGRRKFLAPIYDNPSYIGVETTLLESDLNLSGYIHTSLSKEPKLKDYILEFKKLGFEEVCKKFLKKIEENKKEIKKTVQYSFISKPGKRAFIRFLNKQFNIIGSLKNE